MNTRVWNLLGILTLTAAIAQATPRLEFSQNEWNFGHLWQDDKAEFTLTVKNTGDEDLKISEVRTTCGCTVAQPKRKVIPPGESTTINVIYDTKGKQGDVSSKVIVATNDPRTPRELGNDLRRAQPGEGLFRVKGHVKRAIERTPLGGLVIKTLNTAPGQSDKVRLENKMDHPMQLKLRSNTMRYLDIEIQEIAPGAIYDIVGTTTRPLPYGRYRGQLSFSTGLSREPTYSVSARIEVMRRIEPSVAAMLLRANDPTPQTRVISLHYYGADGPAKFKVTGVETSDPRVKVQMAPTMPPHEWMSKITPPITAQVRTQISLPAGTEFSSKDITITFLTNDPDYPRITVLATTEKSTFEKAIYGTDMNRLPPVKNKK